MAIGFIGSNVSLESILLFAFVFLATVVLGNLAYIVSYRILQSKLSIRMSRILARSVQYIVFALGMYVGFYHVLGLNLTAIGASLGLVGIAVAFSSQQIIQNFIAGVLVAIQQPIAIEEWVEISSFGIARVRDITLTRTVLRDLNGRLISIPNSTVLSASIINYSRSGFFMLPITISVPIDKIEEAKDVIIDAAEKNRRVIPNISRKERNRILGLIKLPHIRKLFEADTNIKEFYPSVLVTGISDTAALLTLHIWILEINKKDNIISEIYEDLSHKLRLKKIF